MRSWKTGLAPRERVSALLRRTRVYGVLSVFDTLLGFLTKSLFVTRMSWRSADAAPCTHHNIDRDRGQGIESWRGHRCCAISHLAEILV